jgi:hypothetical protein
MLTPWDSGIAGAKSVPGDFAGQPAFLGLRGECCAAGVDDGEQRQSEFLCQPHAVLAQLMTFIAGMILETRLESLGQPGRPEQSLASHRKFADAIRDQDSAAAAAAMLEHIELVSDVALLKNG